MDGTEGLSKTGLVTFSGDPAMEKKRIFGRERYWLRIQSAGAAGWGEGDGVEEDQARYPVLERICINTVPARNFSGRAREFFQMEGFQENKHFSLVGKNILSAEVYVDERGYLSDEEWKRLTETGKVREATEDEEGADRIWVRWRQVADFSSSGPSDRHYVIDRLLGVLCFGDGRRGRVPRSSRGDNICIDYCWGGGCHTNLEPGRIDQMERSIGYISKVINPTAMSGGCDAETLEEAQARNASQIRHQCRAVSAGDLEELAQCAAREVQAVKCFAGYDAMGQRLPGAVTMVVLPRQYREGMAQFPVIREKILDHIRGRVSPVLRDSGKLFVRPPELIEIRLSIELSVRGYGETFRVRKELLRRLSELLSPAAGRGAGPGGQIGSLPSVIQIQNAVSDIQGILCIHQIRMKAFAASTVNQEEMDLELAGRCRYAFPINGEHEIIFRQQL